MALSADGNLVVVGGVAHNGGMGVVSAFTRGGGQWRLDKKLVGTGAVGQSAPSVALSADGNIVMVGGPNDNGGVGAAWVFARRGGDWTEEKKLVGDEPAASVAASSNDSIIMIGGSNGRGTVGTTAAFKSGSVADHQERVAPPAAPDHRLSWEE